MKVANLLPDFVLTPEQIAHKHFDDDAKSVALEGLRARLDELRETEAIYENTEPFVRAKAAELQRLQDALVFSRGDETLILQGRAAALFEFVKTPERVRLEIERTEFQISEIETDAG